MKALITINYSVPRFYKLYIGYTFKGLVSHLSRNKHWSILDFRVSCLLCKHPLYLVPPSLSTYHIVHHPNCELYMDNTDSLHYHSKIRVLASSMINTIH